MLKVALLGIGGINEVHRNAWKQIPEAKVVCMCDIRPEQMTEPQKEFDCHTYTDYDEMQTKEEFDVLDITLPTYLHAQYAIRALKAGKHVISEKPVSLNKSDVKAIYDAARESNRCFMVAHCLRFWREYEAVKEAIDTGKYGRLMSGHMERLGNTPGWSWDNWMRDKARSGLVPFDLHIHDLDFLVYALGRPESVEASRACDETQDYIHLLYRYPNCFISAEAAWFNSDYRFRSGFRFQFEHALMEYKDGILTVYREKEKPVTISGEDDAGKDVTAMGSDAYFNEIRYFADCVLAAKPCDKVKPQELIDVLEMIETIEKAD